MKDTYYSRASITDRDIDQLNIAASRLLLDLMPGLETSVVFQVSTIVYLLIQVWQNPINSYISHTKFGLKLINNL